MVSKGSVILEPGQLWGRRWGRGRGEDAAGWRSRCTQTPAANIVSPGLSPTPCLDLIDIIISCPGQLNKWHCVWPRPGVKSVLYKQDSFARKKKWGKKWMEICDIKGGGPYSRSPCCVLLALSRNKWKSKYREYLYLDFLFSYDKAKRTQWGKSVSSDQETQNRLVMSINWGNFLENKSIAVQKIPHNP